MSTVAEIKEAIDRLIARHRAQGGDGLPFADDSLTEDYELGLAIAAAGGRCRFIRARGGDGRLIATRASARYARRGGVLWLYYYCNTRMNAITNLGDVSESNF